MPLVDPAAPSAQVATVALTEGTQEQARVETQVDESLPEKFRGKSAPEIAKSYQDLESEVGRARNEIGTLRRLTDELLLLRRGVPEKSQPDAKPVTPHDLAENPDEVITQVAKRVADERTAGAEARLAELETSLQMDRFEKSYPGFQTTINGQPFMDWLRQKPRRIQLATAAAQNDWEAASELMDLYQGYQSASPTTPKQGESQTPKADAKSVSLAKSGGSGANRVVEGNDGKKVYSREELGRLFIQNPEEYNRRYASEFAQAYIEKRVR